MWGQVTSKQLVIMRARIIPTRVGTSWSPSYADIVTKDHPHACGDKKDFVAECKDGRGSSPRVWGQEKRPKTLCNLPRIIPTRVGTRE